MAGVNRMPVAQFLALDALGSFAWAGLSVGAGYLFREQMEVVLESANKIGSSVGFPAGCRIRWVRGFQVAAAATFCSQTLGVAHHSGGTARAHTSRR